MNRCYRVDRFVYNAVNCNRSFTVVIPVCCKMNAGLSYFLILFCFLAGKALSACNTGDALSFTASNDNALLVNPERGLYHHIEIELPIIGNLDTKKKKDWAPQFSTWNKEGVTLVLVKFAIKKFVTSNFNPTDLDAMTAVFDTLRSLGMKAIVRYSYVQCQRADDTFIFQEDAKKDQLVAHIGQVTPILKNNIDVIYVLQAGFIGCWGEWFYTRNYGVEKNDYKPNAAQKADRLEIMKLLLKAVPGRMVQMRTPALKQAFDECGGKNVQESDAFSTSKMCSKIGIHNDCFLASGRDRDTFKQGNETRQRQWLKKEGIYTVIGGESCEDPKKTNTDCAKTIGQLGEQRFSFLNLDYHEKMVEMWQNTDSVKPKGKCINVIGNYLGYRFQLIDGKLAKTVKKGSTFCASLNVKNSGVASLYNKRPVEVILRNSQSSKEYGPFVQDNIDPRLFTPGETKTIDLSVSLTSDVPAGKYDVILNLPDGSSKLKNNVNYRILFANGGNVQDKKNRYNVIGQITIN